MKALFGKLWSMLGPWLHKVLSQDNGTPSSVRLAMFAVLVPVILVWTGLSIYHRHMEEVPTGLVCLVSTITGLKVGQKFGEKDDCDSAR